MPPAPLPAVELTSAELTAATNHFAVEIGRGGFSVVFYAASLPSQPGAGPAAVKRLNSDSEMGVHDVLREVTILRTCEHENLLPLLGYCLDAAAPCLVFPLCAGGSLHDRIVLHAESRARLAAVGTVDPPPLGCRERLSILCGVARALIYLHTATATKRQTLHRDVKPGNVLLTRDNRPLLADTGLAKAAEDAVQQTHMSTARLMGTPGFDDPLSVMQVPRALLRRSTPHIPHAPLLPPQHSEMSDAFAFGVTALVTLTGQPPVDRRNAPLIFSEAMADPSRSVARADGPDPTAGFPDDVATAVMKVVVGLSFAAGTAAAAVAGSGRPLRRPT